MSEKAASQTNYRFKRTIAQLENVFSSSDFVADFLKLFIGGVVFSVTIFGYSYTNSLFRYYGIGLNNVGYGPLDFLFRGLFFVVSSTSILWYLLLIVIITAASVIAWIYVRLASIPIMCMFVLLLIWGARHEGNRIAAEQVNQTSAGNVGRPIQCQLKQASSTNQEQLQFKSMIEALGNSNRLRLIFRDEYFIHVAVVLPENQKGKANEIPPQSFAIPNIEILCCRTWGYSVFRT